MDNKVYYMKKIFPPDLWTKARIAALASGKKLTEWLTEAVEEKLNKENKK